jgi:hypothetical protein
VQITLKSSVEQHQINCNTFVELLLTRYRKQSYCLEFISVISAKTVHKYKSNYFLLCSIH